MPVADPERLSRGGQNPWRALALAYSGGLGAEPQRSPGAEPLVGGQGGEATLKLKAFQSLDVERRPQICHFLAFWEVHLVET